MALYKRRKSGLIVPKEKPKEWYELERHQFWPTIGFFDYENVQYGEEYTIGHRERCCNEGMGAVRASWIKFTEVPDDKMVYACNLCGEVRGSSNDVKLKE
jgi:hypothetical protein